jgi:hypothetical protein
MLVSASDVTQLLDGIQQGDPKGMAGRFTQ